MEKNLLIIVIGESGSGKSIFINSAISKDNTYNSSKPMLDELKRRNVEINHDAMFALSKELYEKNPYWQIPITLDELEKKKFLIVDGLRREPEISQLKNTGNTIVVRIVSSLENRFDRLKRREKNRIHTIEEFEQLNKDESEMMNSNELSKVADITIVNKFSELTHKKDDFLRKGKRFGRMLKFIPSFMPKSITVFLLRMSVI